MRAERRAVKAEAELDRLRQALKAQEDGLEKENAALRAPLLQNRLWVGRLSEMLAARGEA